MLHHRRGARQPAVGESVGRGGGGRCWRAEVGGGIGWVGRVEGVVRRGGGGVVSRRGVLQLLLLLRRWWVWRQMGMQRARAV